MSHGCNRLPHQHQSRPMSVRHQETRSRHSLRFRSAAKGPISIPPGLPIQRHWRAFPAPVTESSANSGLRRLTVPIPKSLRTLTGTPRDRVGRTMGNKLPFSTLKAQEVAVLLLPPPPPLAGTNTPFP